MPSAVSGPGVQPAGELLSADATALSASVEAASSSARLDLGLVRQVRNWRGPTLLQDRGLAAALRARLQGVETRAGLVTHFDCAGEERLSPDKEQELYRIAQEALNNVLKHAHDGRVDVRLAIADRDATLEIFDDGVGFDSSLSGGYGLGLRGMHERVERLGGTLRIETSPGAGMHVRVDVPR